ncbi:hypothetical protein AUEXF2481DRAFT_36414 [Aureobasidium subglaciale EXF-2481]|uniref:NAD(P)-binding domain-containing protein n=1 Tax=Aureobasidium subglaciale (strain EXF-2481) TaxID=1043005 RepID=A0A074YN81_AURSE|nr:uncharacterized protein AUEXF2481DRAFT_36414 [Aureobasidium subglaciale EXF-2481]KEQ99115.1 hypothetical protein AUEXF2481DRAFT_36414 [Aureobasidium subglaciale EXF-2481]
MEQERCGSNDACKSAEPFPPSPAVFGLSPHVTRLGSRNSDMLGGRRHIKSEAVAMLQMTKQADQSISNFNPHTDSIITLNMTSFIKKVAIVGASGNMGSHTINELLRLGNHEVTALTRKGSNLSVPPAVNIIEVDYDDISNLTEALKGQDFLMITLSVTAPDHIHSNLVSAAGAAGIKYVMPNAYGFDFTNPDVVADIPVASKVYSYFPQIEELGMSHFSLVCSFWYEWSLGIGDLYGIDIREKKATFFDDGKTVINTSTWEQCGRAVAKILSLPVEGGDNSLEAYKNKSFYISSFRVSQRDMLDSVHRVLGTSDADWEIGYQPSKERYAKGMEAMKTGDRTAFAKAMYSRVFYPDGSGDYQSRRGLDNEVLGLPTEELDEATKRTVELVETGWNPFGQ